MTVRLRFAPSPTGHLHIGGARTALFNWLYARKHGGAFVLRLEDTDRERSREEYEREIVRDLAWLGLDWDEGPGVGGPHGPYRQTERVQLYQEALDHLLETGQAYRCTCPPERLAALREQALREGRDPKYDGHCRELNLGPDCGPHVVRFKMPLEGETVVDDLVKGRVVFANEQMDDFVLRRTDGTFTYNFAVVVDDWKMGMTHVIRGDDHLSNTPKQVRIYRALGAEPPRFGHVPLILGPDGKRLSKRHGATSVGAYREMGYLPHALVNYLVRLGWAHGDQEIFTPEELRELFDFSGIGRSAGRWNADKLLWVNQHWIAHLEPEELLRHLQPFLEARGIRGERGRLLRAMLSVRERAKTLDDLAERMAFYFVPDEELEYDPAAVRKILKPAALERLEALLPLLERIEPWDEAGIEAALARWLEERSLKLRAVAQPIRVCVTGQKAGPGLYETLAVLGREHSLARLRRGMERARRLREQGA